MRPCTELNPCEPPTKYAVVFDEQPMPDSFTSCSGRSASPQQASMIEAVTESWPHPAHKVDMLPSYWRRVIPNELVGSDGSATLGLLMYDMVELVQARGTAVSRGASASFALIPLTIGSADLGNPL